MSKPRKVRVSTYVTPQTLALIDSIVGTIYGATRADVVRFMLQSWFTDANLTAMQHARQRRQEYDDAQRRRG